MDQLSSVATPVQLVIHNDETTPMGFVMQLLQEVFGKYEQDAFALTLLIDQQDKAVCGPYPPSVAQALLEAAQERIGRAGHALQITSEAAADASASDPSELLQFEYGCEAIDWHFADIPSDQLVTMVRRFPGHTRADVQAAIDKLFPSPIRFFGAYEEYRYEALTFARLKRRGRGAIPLAPPQYNEVDVGEARPVRCLHNGLWLCHDGDIRYAVVLSYDREYGREPMIRVEIAVPVGVAGDAFVQRCFAELQQAVHAARSYRGKILSLDGDADYSGRSHGVTVHRLPAVDRDDVILPEPALKLLDRNVLRFVGTRDALRRLGQSTRKGILLYGPPGTGKTHTIRYLATNLPGHTTLLITAEQVGLLGPYMTLARLLQPTMVVIEDVDLIASDRDDMGPCEESLLNKLLNEMDGLKEDADILFVLTTNRPEALEAALAGRPGRIDQAIEVPLPDATGRGKLVRLYGRGPAAGRADRHRGRAPHRGCQRGLHQGADAPHRAVQPCPR
jgi:ATP-dependent Clp protease adapter protein ClpS